MAIQNITINLMQRSRFIWISGGCDVKSCSIPSKKTLEPIGVSPTHQSMSFEEKDNWIQIMILPMPHGQGL